jgi:hypothetical protein
MSMKLSDILSHIDNGHMALPEFQRGYVWNRDQVRGLMQSLYRRYPVGGFLVWATQSEGAAARGDANLAAGVVKLLLDGQQRVTSLYGVIRGQAPPFFEGNAQAFTDLRFNLKTEEFAFHSPIKMDGDPLWINVTRLMKENITPFLTPLAADPDFAEYVKRLSALHSIQDINFHIEEVTGPDKTIDVVVDIFNRVNSGGTKLSKGDLALAKVCAEAPKARENMKASLKKWRGAGYHFELDWLLRNVNTISTGQARFEAMHNISAGEFEDGMKRAEKAVDYLLNVISGRMGLDHDRVLFGRGALPLLSNYVDRRGGKLADAVEQDRLLFWYIQSAMWGRYSGSTESVLDKDLKLIQKLDGGLDRLIEELKLWRGSLRVQPGHFAAFSQGARFYPVLYLLTRIGEAKDWGNGLALKQQLLGKLNKLEVHHIFPKAYLYKLGHRRSDVNSIANFCFLTKGTNLNISDTAPEKYFPEVEKAHPGALASQWIPMDPELWKGENYLAFLEARRALLAEATNRFLEELLHGQSLGDIAPATQRIVPAAAPAAIPGDIGSELEEAELLAVNEWVVAQGLPEGFLSHELAHPETGEPQAILDLAWPNGLQEGLSQPIALLLNEGPDTQEVVNAHGYRFFTSADAFKAHVTRDVLALA